MSEKETLLKVGPPTLWRKWAECPWERRERCLLCMAYPKSCQECRKAGGHDPMKGGCRSSTEHLTASQSAITRLKRVGIWEGD